jgi:hypothetical protein
MLNLIVTICFAVAPIVENGRSQREAVATIRQMGGQVVYSYEQQSDQLGFFSYYTKSPIPAQLRDIAGDDYFFRINAVSFGCHGEPSITAADFGRVIEPLARLRSLKAFGLACTNLKSSDLAAIGQLKCLRLLTLDGVDVKGEKLTFLRELDELEEVEIYAYNLHREALISLAKLPRLTDLDIGGQWINHHDLSLLSASPRLDTLEVRSPNLSGDGLKYLSDFNRLRELRFGSTSLTIGDCQHLAKIATLEYLDLCPSQLASCGLSQETKIGDCLRELVHAPNIRSLRLEAPITSSDYAVLKNFPHLEHLYIIGGPEIGAASIEELKQFTHLKLIYAPMTQSHRAVLLRHSLTLRVYAEE